MSRFTCMPGDMAVGRRSVLAGASALVALGAPARAASLTELVGADGRIAPGAAALADRHVRLVGYLAPSFEPGNDDWRLTEAIAMPCQLCGAGHDDDPAVLVRMVQAPDLSPLQAVAVVGRVDFSGAAPRLIDARVEAL